MSIGKEADKGTDNPATPVPTELLSDPTASAIHDAFLMGWSLTELRSRIQTKLLEIVAAAKDRNPQQDTQSTPNNANTTQSLPATAQSAPSQADTWLKEGEKLARNALLTPVRNETSEWRSLFGRIAAIQNKRFPNSTTVDTSYDPHLDSQFTYLQAKYADDGIISLKDNTLAQFQLYDATRKTLNCLILLYTNIDESLFPHLISNYQGELVQQILKPDSQGPAAQNGTDQKSPLQPNELDQARTELSDFAIRLLNAWDDYLRENYYTDGYLPENELELVAYEGGRSLARISWWVTIKVEPLEKNLSALPKSTMQQDTQSPDLNTLKEQLNQAWKDIFKERDIIHIQHQIAALKTALDDAYYRTSKQTQPSAQDAVLVRLDLNLPSHALEAVITSLDYWQRGVAWICEQDSKQTTSDQPFWTQSQALRIALIQQADVWQSLILCQQSLRSFSVQSVTHKILTKFMDKFQRFASQGLSQAAQASAQDIASATNQIKKDIFRENWPILLVALIAIIVVLAVLFALLFLIPGLADSLKGIFSGLLVVATGALGGGGIYARNKASTTQDQQPPQGNVNAPTAAVSGTNLLDRFSNFLGSFGSTITTDFYRGYQQILIEFDNLNHNVSVAFPLIVFFTTTPLSFTTDIIDSYSFLTTVIWTEEERAQEMDRIVQAAFGPLGAIVDAQMPPIQTNGDKCPDPP